MILVDANLLLYAHNEDSPWFEAASTWLNEIAAGSENLALSWLTICAFLRISTDSRMMPNPLTTAVAAEVVTEWLKNPNVVVLDPGDKHWRIFSQLLLASRVTGPLVMDAHLAALGIEHDATVATTDRDFERFRGLKLVNPLRVGEV